MVHTLHPIAEAEMAACGELGNSSPGLHGAPLTLLRRETPILHRV